MRLLVLGGTGFVGRAVVEAGLARGAEITVLNRGRRPALAAVTSLVGDRSTDQGLVALAGTAEWDLVVDTWSAAPLVVDNAARLLSGRAGRYAYVSSRSVYTYPPKRGLGEDGPLVESSPDAGRDGAAVDYAQAKRGGELAVEAAFGDRALLLRAGLILGPHEDVSRLPWWLLRIARGGPVLAPGPRDLGLQYIDARGAQADLRWVEPKVILDARVQPWTDLPIWLPPGEEHDGMHRGDVTKALTAGLHCRPIAETVADTWAWLQTLDGEPPQRADRPRLGLDPAVEASILRL
jgi:NAD-dependent epimerase/dehydratase family protein